MAHGLHYLYFAPRIGFPLPPGFSLSDWYPRTGLSIPGFRFPPPQFCHTAVQESPPVVHRLRLSSSPLGPDLPGQISFTWKPWIFGLKDLTFISLLIPAFSLPCSPQLLPVLLRSACNAPLPILADPLVSVVRFSPGHFRRRASRPVSYYALFE